MYGYMGKVLRVNLTKGTCLYEDLNMENAKNFIGARGLGVKTYIDEVDPNVEAISEENKIILATGPVTGTMAPTGGRYMVISKAPLTGTIGTANSGGFFGTHIKKSGLDMIIIEGKAKEPVYLLIEDDKAELRSAKHLWGKKLEDTTKTLKSETSNKHKILAIGPAGENLSLMSAIMNDIDRAAGRGGMGAIMGFKNLKAISILGTQTVKVPNKDKFREVAKEKINLIKNDPVGGTGLRAYGTAVLVNIINENGMHPVKNFKEGYTGLEKIDKVSGETLASEHLTRAVGCASCPISCGREVKLPNGDIVGGPEYETIWSFGPDCDNYDLDSVNILNMLCNEYGLDTISAGATLAAAMELYENGFIKDEELQSDGLSLKWGDKDSMIKWLHKIALREGFGAKMTDGSYRLCESYDQVDTSMSVKKQEVAAYDPRGAKGIGLNYATNNRGGCHIKGYMINPEILGYPTKVDRLTDDKDKVDLTVIVQNLTAVVDSMGMCIFTTFGLKDNQDYADILNAVCGTDYTGDTLLEVGERIYSLERMYNEKCGFSRADDTLPKRLTDEAMPSGPVKGEKVNLEKMLDNYYISRGWSQDGIVTEETKKHLGLQDCFA
ncbi:tungsten-containing aldehyde:ferredoxin oxidoreductase Aor [Gottschalkia purinilytica]|uniref:Tungsten-containing aldehyde:ferredoxin oxidoreductase Aor n=1 Tax=Gottschalkia purinilytica TaxID=1503 RepID=A0A0L0W945_GOTPU|nr:aldehyde ferredoxin oxidoreductase family protein [Gottschalkia purinilytica]KNF07956.1 tungsten-containing aldehyde:ferredoxin oxidoreductase Aor [Gottschalkia purinilytica]